MLPPNLKVALVHYWMVSMRGGEKVLEQLCEMFPQADIYTLVAVPENLSPTLRRHSITTSFLQRLPGGNRRYQSLLPLMPFAIESFDLSGYDLVISSDANVAKGVVTPTRTLHLNYCHSPMRYAWDLYHDYMRGSGLGRFKKIAMGAVMNYMRVWDVAAANRVDGFMANSINVQKRIRKHYRRESEVVHPPVDLEGFAKSESSGDYDLMLGQVIPYKRVDLAVEAYNRSGRRLLIVGEGSDLSKLKAVAKSNIQFLGRQEQKSIVKLYSECRAFIFPGEEDFGITPLEAQASGKPVIAYGRGGALETVIAGETGLFFSEQSADSLSAAVESLESGAHAITPAKCRANAERFSAGRFRESVARFVDTAWESHRGGEGDRA